MAWAMKTEANPRRKYFIEIRDFSPSLEMTGLRFRWLLGSRRRCGSGRFFLQQGIDAPASRTIKDNKQENPAIKHRELTLVRDWEKFGHWRCGAADMKHEISERHFTATNERAKTRKQAEGDEKSTNKLNPAAGL